MLYDRNNPSSWGSLSSAHTHPPPGTENPLNIVQIRFRNCTGRVVSPPKRDRIQHTPYQRVNTRVVPVNTAMG